MRSLTHILSTLLVYAILFDTLFVLAMPLPFAKMRLRQPKSKRQIDLVECSDMEPVATSSAEVDIAIASSSVPVTSTVVVTAPVSAIPTTIPAIATSVVPSSSSTPSVGAGVSSSLSDSIPSTTASLSATATAQPSQPPQAGQRSVVAHHMVGNTYPYTVSDWEDDINLAHAFGIDAFALNIGSDSWQKDHVADAYQAAENTGTGFKLFLSFDMSALPCATPQDAQNLQSYITTYASHPNQFKYSLSGPTKPFASTFSGETCLFGQGSFQDGWRSQFKQPLEANGGPGVFFVPSFFIDPSTLGSLDFIDGDFNWNSAWPTSLTTSSLSSLTVGTLSGLVGSLTPDDTHLSALATAPTPKAYMASASPWFFTHYSPQTFNKNWIYLSDDHLYAKRWEQLIGARNKANIVEVITWNDYGESHYIGPIKGDQPNSQAWVDGMDHTAWLNMTLYYATAFKTGKYPEIKEDKIYMWSRPHLRDAVASDDSVGRPDNFQLTSDTLWAVAFTTAPSTVTLQTSPTTAQSFNVPAGVSKLQMPLNAGDTMHAIIERNGNKVVDFAPEGFVFEANPKTYNFNAFVAASP